MVAYILGEGGGHAARLASIRDTLHDSSLPLPPPTQQALHDLVARSLQETARPLLANLQVSSRALHSGLHPRGPLSILGCALHSTSPHFGPAPLPL